MTEEHRQWIQKAVAGDKEALGDLLLFYGPIVQSGLQISSTWQRLLEPGDVMQVTYLEAFTRIRSFDAARSEAFHAWLRQIAENNLRDAIRALDARKNPSPRLQLDDAATGDSAVALLNMLSSGSGTPSRAARADEARTVLADALRCLPRDYARAVQLLDLEARPVEEVAMTLERSIGAVYMLRLRAHGRLRELLGHASRILESGA